MSSRPRPRRSAATSGRGTARGRRSPWTPIATRRPRPVQVCLLVRENNVSQNVHNLIVVEEGAEVELVTGCTLRPGVATGLHIGITEIFLARGATLADTMIHNWAAGFTSGRARGSSPRRTRRSDTARIHAIPALAAEGALRRTPAHEAAVGPIADEAVEYLMTRGIRRDDAVAMLVRGFLRLDLPYLPPVLARQIDQVLATTDERSL